MGALQVTSLRQFCPLTIKCWFDNFSLCNVNICPLIRPYHLVLHQARTQGRGDAWNFGSFEHLFSFWIKFVIFCLIYEYCELLKVSVLTPMFIQFQPSPGIPAPHHPPYVRACCLFLISLKNDCLNRLWHKYLSPGLFMFTEISVCNFACANTF